MPVVISNTASAVRENTADGSLVGHRIVLGANDRLWVAEPSIVNQSYKFRYSDDDGATWTEAVGLRIPITASMESYGSDFTINNALGIAGFVLRERDPGVNAYTFKWYYASNFGPSATWVEVNAVVDDLTPVGVCPPAIRVVPHPDNNNFIVVTAFTVGYSTTNQTKALLYQTEYTDAGVLVNDGYTEKTAFGTPQRLFLDYRHDKDGSTLLNGVNPDLILVKQSEFLSNVSSYANKLFFGPTFPYYDMSAFASTSAYEVKPPNVNQGYPGIASDGTKLAFAWADTGYYTTTAEEMEHAVLELDFSGVNAFGSKTNLPYLPEEFRASPVTDRHKTVQCAYSLNGNIHVIVELVSQLGFVKSTWNKEENIWSNWDFISYGGTSALSLRITEVNQEKIHWTYYNIDDSTLLHESCSAESVYIGKPIITPQWVYNATTDPNPGQNRASAPARDGNGRLWVAINQPSQLYGYNWDMYYSENNGITWVKNAAMADFDSLTGSTSTPPILKIDPGTNIAYMFHNNKILYCLNIVPGASWAVLGTVNPDRNNSLGHSSLVGFVDQYDSNLFRIMFIRYYTYSSGAPDYITTRYLTWVEAILNRTTLAVEQGMQDVRSSTSSNSMWRGIFPEHNGDGFTPPGPGNPSIHEVYRSVNNTSFIFYRTDWDPVLEVYDHDNSSHVQSQFASILNSHATIMFDGTNFWIIDKNANTSPDVRVEKIVASTYVRSWFTLPNALGTDILRTRATINPDTQEMIVYIMDEDEWIYYNIMDMSNETWSGWTKWIHYGPEPVNDWVTFEPVVFTDSATGNVATMRQKRYTNIENLEANIQVFLNMATWIGSRVYIASGLKALVRLANNAAAAIRLPNGLRL